MVSRAHILLALVLVCIFALTSAEFYAIPVTETVSADNITAAFSTDGACISFANTTQDPDYLIAPASYAEYNTTVYVATAAALTNDTCLSALGVTADTLVASDAECFTQCQNATEVSSTTCACAALIYASYPLGVADVATLEGLLTSTQDCANVLNTSDIASDVVDAPIDVYNYTEEHVFIASYQALPDACLAAINVTADAVQLVDQTCLTDCQADEALNCTCASAVNVTTYVFAAEFNTTANRSVDDILSVLNDTANCPDVLVENTSVVAANVSYDFGEGISAAFFQAQNETIPESCATALAAIDVNSVEVNATCLVGCGDETCPCLNVTGFVFVSEYNNTNVTFDDISAILNNDTVCPDVLTNGSQLIEADSEYDFAGLSAIFFEAQAQTLPTDCANALVALNVTTQEVATSCYTQCGDESCPCVQAPVIYVFAVEYTADNVTLDSITTVLNSDVCSGVLVSDVAPKQADSTYNFGSVSAVLFESNVETINTDCAAALNDLSTTLVALDNTCYDACSSDAASLCPCAVVSTVSTYTVALGSVAFDTFNDALASPCASSLVAQTDGTANPKNPSTDDYAFSSSVAIVQFTVPQAQLPPLCAVVVANFQITLVQDACLEACIADDLTCPCPASASSWDQFFIYDVEVNRAYRANPSDAVCASYNGDGCDAQPADWACSNGTYSVVSTSISGHDNSTRSYIAAKSPCTSEVFQQWKQFNTTVASDSVSAWDVDADALDSCYDSNTTAWQTCVDCPLIPCATGAACSANTTTCIFGSCQSNPADAAQEICVDNAASRYTFMAAFGIVVLAMAALF